jgi:hypothetical protein
MATRTRQQVEEELRQAKAERDGLIEAITTLHKRYGTEWCPDGREAVMEAFEEVGVRIPGLNEEIVFRIEYRMVPTHGSMDDFLNADRTGFANRDVEDRVRDAFYMGIEEVTIAGIGYGDEETILAAPDSETVSEFLTISIVKTD